MSLLLAECDKFTDHRRAICRGEREDISKKDVDLYRRQWGLSPLYSQSHTDPLPSVAIPSIDPSSEVVMTKYPGTNLAILLKAFGAPVKDGCGCEEWIAKMNNWGVDGCFGNRQEIVDRLREKSAGLSVIQKLTVGVLMLWNGKKPTIGELVDEAIWQAKQAGG